MNQEAHDQTVTVTLEGSNYRVVPTAFRSHFQVVGDDGKLLGLLELVEVMGSPKFMARPASGTGMTQALMMRIADAVSATGLFGDL